MTTADKTILMLALAVIAALYAHFWTPAPAAESARVSIAGKPDQRIDLDADRTVVIDGVLGPTELEIRAGRIRFRRAPCLGKQCIHSGWLASDGDFAACLPNGIAVQVEGKGTGFDAINF
ncbi:MAG: NusG domain II-containing protein [Gammaproteobacteria bacterium]